MEQNKTQDVPLWKTALFTFLKGIVVGLGAIAPGLSGSVLLVIFSLYEKTIAAISGFFKDIKNNLLFLIPLVGGMGIGVVLFSNVIKFFGDNFPMQTNFTFFGLILGTVPLLYREVRKKGFPPFYWLFTIGALGLGIFLFWINAASFPTIQDPFLWQSMLLGLAVAASYIIPGVDSAAILKALGMYDLWRDSLAALDFSVLLPAAVGVVVGVLLMAFLIHFLLTKYYTATYSVIFGIFLSVVPSVLREDVSLGWDFPTILSFVLMLFGLAFSLVFSHLEEIIAYWKKKKEPPQEDAPS